MRKKHWLALGSLLGAMVMVLAVASPAQSQNKAAEKQGETLAQKVAKGARLPEENANRFLEALGPALRAELAAGKTVSLPGLGTFRVVRIPQHQNMTTGGRNGGVPYTVAGVNNVEFLPDGALSSAANSATAQPAVVVPPFEYHILPGQTPGQKTGRTRVPDRRVP